MPTFRHILHGDTSNSTLAERESQRAPEVQRVRVPGLRIINTFRCGMILEQGTVEELKECALRSLHPIGCGKCLGLFAVSVKHLPLKTIRQTAWTFEVCPFCKTKIQVCHHL